MVPPPGYGVPACNGAVNTNFSPVVDLKPTQSSRALDFPTRIAARAIAAELEIVARVAVAYSQGLLAGGVLPTAKHFPGLGSVAADTHHFSAHIKLSMAQLRRRDWVPFRRVRRDNSRAWKRAVPGWAGYDPCYGVVPAESRPPD
jgi:beta-N-acetylhexosaminidase